MPRLVGSHQLSAAVDGSARSTTVINRDHSKRHEDQGWRVALEGEKGLLGAQKEIQDDIPVLGCHAAGLAGCSKSPVRSRV